MFCIGDVSEEKKKLVRVTKECVDLALAATKPWGTMGDMGYVCNKHAVENGYSVVREIEDMAVGYSSMKNHGSIISGNRMKVFFCAGNDIYD